MPLPKRTIPKSEIFIPSLDESRLFRPFLVEEEKALLIASEAGDDAVLLKTTLDVIKNCYADEKPLDSKKLAIFDLIFIFLKLRAISVSNILEMRYKDSEDNKIREFSLDINDLELVMNPGHSRTIELDDGIKIRLKYPSVEDSLELNEDETIESFLDRVIINLIDKIYDNDTVYEDYSSEELIEFYRTLPAGTYFEFKKFFDTMPKVEQVIRYENDMGNKVEISLSSLSDFFLWLWVERDHLQNITN